MKPNRTIQFKAFLLLIVFSFSTVISFACSVGLDMGYNSDHHSEKKQTTIKCCEKPAGTSENQSSEEEDCCTNLVIDFQLMAKSISQYNIDFSVPVTMLHHDVMEFLLSSDQFRISTEMKWAVFRTNHLAPPDIRVSIRSFQI